MNFTDQLPLTLSRPVHQDYPQISNVIADYFSDLLSCQKSVEDALMEMERDIKDIIEEAPVLPGIEIPGYSIAILVMTTAFSIGLIVVLRRRHR